MLTLARYIGNKVDLLEPILGEVAKHSSPGDLVCDAFSGTLAVSLELKRRGYRVASNDINAFSNVFGTAYLTGDDVATVDLAPLVPAQRLTALRDSATRQVDVLAGNDGYRFLDEPAQKAAYVEFATALAYLASATERDLPTRARRHYMHDIYSPEGRRSAFVSSRGRAGQRNFFSPANARRLDIALCHLRLWHQTSAVSEHGIASMLAVLMSAVEKVSNTQGTYHDFPRDVPDPRAARPIKLVPPPLDGMIGTNRDHVLGVERDSLEWIAEVPAHRALYLDPPYNFRQYTAYYFLLNVLARYVYLPDLETYFAGIKYVRGQNPTDDFNSTFSKPRQFVESLESLIGQAKSQWVILSYFNGRNHWGEFKSEATDTIGYAKMDALFRSHLFRDGSLEVVPIPRMNYQSYGGYRAKPVDEYLFVAERAA